jgi:hypothetical protein
MQIGFIANITTPHLSEVKKILVRRVADLEPDDGVLVYPAEEISNLGQAVADVTRLRYQKYFSWRDAIKQIKTALSLHDESKIIVMITDVIQDTDVYEINMATKPGILGAEFDFHMIGLNIDLQSLEHVNKSEVKLSDEIWERLKDIHV